MAEYALQFIPVMIWIGWFLIVNQISGLQFTLQPHSLALTNPKQAENLTELLFKTENFGALNDLLQTRAFDYNSIYCAVWSKRGNLEKLQTILRKADPSVQRSLLNPNCLMCSRILLRELNEQESFELFSELPVSFLEAANFQATLFSPDTFDALLSDALQRHLKNRQMRWFDWFDDINLEKLPHLNRQWQSFYYERGWLFVAPSVFADASERIQKILLSWLFPVDKELAEEVKFLRKLALVACRRAAPSMVWSGGGWSNELEFTESSLMNLIRSSKPTNHFHGDWFVEIILSLWKPTLTQLNDADLSEVLEFLFSNLWPSVRGTCTLLERSEDLRIFEFIRGRENEEFFELLLRECGAEVPQLSVLPLQMRWNYFSQSLGSFAGNFNRCSGSSFKVLQKLSFCCASFVSLPKSREDVKMILEAMIEEKWFNTGTLKGKRLPNARMPRQFGRLLGFYALLARVYGLSHVLQLDSSFYSSSAPRTDVEDGELHCQFSLSLDNTPNQSPLPYHLVDDNFNCHSHTDQFILEANMQDDFNSIVLSPESVKFSPQSTQRTVLKCQENLIIYTEFLRREFERGLEIHKNVSLFSGAELQRILDGPQIIK